MQIQIFVAKTLNEDLYEHKDQFEVSNWANFDCFFSGIASLAGKGARSLAILITVTVNENLPLCFR